MKSAAIYAPLVAAAAVQAFTINTPASVTQCQPTLISWDASDSQAPYYLSILPGDNPSGSPLKQFNIESGSSYSWSTDIQGGTSIGLTLKDSTGKTVQSAPVTIENSCNAATTTTAASSTVTSPASSSSSSASRSSSSSSRSSTSSSSAASSSASSSSDDENGALVNGASLGVAGAVAALVAFLA
ncbi:hypothetical protein HDZ31DRAFT_47919 [Schizophyllum fasciatum]